MTIIKYPMAAAGNRSSDDLGQLGPGIAAADASAWPVSRRPVKHPSEDTPDTGNCVR